MRATVKALTTYRGLTVPASLTLPTFGVALGLLAGCGTGEEVDETDVIQSEDSSEADVSGTSTDELIFFADDLNSTVGSKSKTTESSELRTTADICIDDLQCAGVAPFCVDERCVSCGDASSRSCDDLGEELAICDVATGECRGCEADDECEQEDGQNHGCDFVQGLCRTQSLIAVAVGYGARRLRSNDGVEWTDFLELDANGGDDDNLLRGVGYGDGVFVAVGGAGNGLAMTSVDGVTWENEDRSIRDFLSDVVFFDGRFVTVGGNGLKTYSDDLGASWDAGTQYEPAHYRGLATNGEVVVAVGHTYGDLSIGRIALSFDGQQWEPPVDGGQTLHRIEFGNGVFVAAGQNGRVIASTNGHDWTETVLSDTYSYNVGFANAEFLSPTTEGYYRSADGVSWRFEAAENTREIAGFFAGKYLHLGWPASIVSSSGLEFWISQWSRDGAGLTQMAVGVPSEG